MISSFLYGLSLVHCCRFYSQWFTIATNKCHLLQKPAVLGPDGFISCWTALSQLAMEYGVSRALWVDVKSECVCVYVCVGGESFENKSCSVVSDSWRPRGPYIPWNSPGQNTGVGSLSLLQGIFPTHGSNPGFPHCRQILYQLNHQRSPRILEWVAYPFSSRPSWPRNWTVVSWTAGGFFTSWATGEALVLWAYYMPGIALT